MKIIILSCAILLGVIFFGCDLSLSPAPNYTDNTETKNVEVIRFHNDSTGMAMSATHTRMYLKHNRNGEAYANLTISSKWKFEAYLAGQYEIMFWSSDLAVPDSSLPKKISFIAPPTGNYVYELDMQNYSKLNLNVNINLKFDKYSWLIRTEKGFY